MVVFAKQLMGVLLASLVLIAGGARAESEWREGEHYKVVSPAVRVGPTDQVIVTEFFWYGCGHCYTFEPMLQAWKQSLPDGSRLQPSPAMWNDGMKLHAKAYFTAETLGVLDPMHSVIFKAMHVDRNRLASKGAIRELFVANGMPTSTRPLIPSGSTARSTRPRPGPGRPRYPARRQFSSTANS